MKPDGICGTVNYGEDCENCRNFVDDCGCSILEKELKFSLSPCHIYFLCDDYESRKDF
jgi:hypothetical protein